jgi:hypothetical protein
MIDRSEDRIHDLRYRVATDVPARPFDRVKIVGDFSYAAWVR